MARKRQEDVRTVLTRYEQGHMLRFWDQLDDRQRKAFAKRLLSFDYELLRRLIKNESVGQAAPPSLAELEEPEVIRLPNTPDEIKKRDVAMQRGLDAMRSGQVAVLVVAGGQGSRLGFDGPKGCYPVGPVTERTLFQLHAQKILAASKRAGRPVPWYIMTSEANDKATRGFLRKNKHFGLHPEDVFIFTQGMMPAVTPEGKLILAAPDRAFVAPNGHGGTLSALIDSGALDDMTGRGIEHIYYFQVDNPMVPVPDPVFLGHHIAAKAEMSSKVLSKRTKDEPIGTVVKRGGRVEVVEYSDITPDVRDAVNSEGDMRWPFGSIAIHALAVGFLKRFAAGHLQLPFHRAKKKISYCDDDGNIVVPDSPNGIKFEMFVFDALRYAERSVTMEVARDDEFAPVKNAKGQDSVATSRAALTAQYARWLEACGVEVQRDEGGLVAGAIEINPLTADTVESLKENLPEDVEFRDGMVI